MSTRAPRPPASKPAAVRYWTLRERTGLTQTRFAALLGVAASTINTAERGRREPAPHVVLLYALLEDAMQHTDPAGISPALLPCGGELRCIVRQLVRMTP